MQPILNRAVMLGLCLVFSQLLLAQPGGRDGGMPPALVEVAEVVETSLAPVTWVAGTVVSRSDAQLSAEQEGRILEVLDVGSVVIQGDVIARIDDRSLALRVAELEAEVARTQARLGYLESEYQRQQELSERQLTSATLLEQTRSEQRVADSELKVAQSRLDQARDDLDRTQIRAPFDGVVVERMVQLGERVSEGTVVIRLKDPNNLEVIARPPLSFMPFVQIGQYLQVDSAHSQGNWPVRTVVSLGNEATHVFELRLDVDADQFASGETLRVAVPIADREQVVAVPRDALVLRADGVSVYVVNSDQTVRRISVIPGVGDHYYVGVRGELWPGEMVITRGNERLQPGQTVQVNEA